MKNTLKALQLHIIEDYRPEVSQDRSPHLSLPALELEQEDSSDYITIIQEEDSEVDEWSFIDPSTLSVIMPIMTLINLQLTSFASTVETFVAVGPSMEFNGRGLLLQAYSRFQENEIRALREQVAPGVDGSSTIPDMVAFLTRPVIVNEMARAFKALLSQNETPIDAMQLRNIVDSCRVLNHINNQLVEIRADNAIEQIQSGQCNLVQYYKLNHNGLCSTQPITVLVSKEEYNNLINGIRDNAGFIKTLTAESLIRGLTIIGTESGAKDFLSFI